MTIAPTCPQLVEPEMDFLAYTLLTQLRHGEHMVVGAKAIKTLIVEGNMRPVAVIVTHSPQAHVAACVDDLRQACTAAGVPVVHALTPPFLAMACKSKTDQAAAAVLVVPQGRVYKMMQQLLLQAQKAYHGFYKEAVAAACKAALSLPPDAMPTLPPPPALSIPAFDIHVPVVPVVPTVPTGLSYDACYS